MKKLLIILFLSLTITTNIWGIDYNHCRAVVHINGITTSAIDAQKNLDKLMFVYQSDTETLEYFLAYNPTKGFIGDVIDVINTNTFNQCLAIPSRSCLAMAL